MYQNFTLLITLTLLIIFNSVIQLVQTGCVNDKEDSAHLMCQDSLLKEINSKQNKVTYTKLSILGKTTKKIRQTALDYKALHTLVIDRASLKEIDNDSFANLEGLERIEITWTELKIIKQKSFNKLYHLKYLILKANKIRKIEINAFDTLTDLIELDLAINQIEKIDNGLFDQLNNLESLVLSSNKIKELPTELFSNLHNLKKFRISVNRLKTISDKTFTTHPLVLTESFAGPVSAIEVLELSDNKIEKLNKHSFLFLDNLKRLQLEGNPLKNIDKDVFSSLINLEALVLSTTSLTSSQLATINWKNLKKLKFLDLRKNKIQTIQGSMFQSMKNLEFLSLSQNQIHTLTPDMFNYTKNLKRLDLYANRIQKIHNNVFNNMHNLKELHLQVNQIDEIENGAFSQLKVLTQLYLHTNKIKQLSYDTFSIIRGSETLDVTSKLLVLNLGYNQIERIDANVFKTLKKLNTLSLNNNSIRQLPGNLFKSMSNLEILNLGKNQLSDLPIKIFVPLRNSLKILDLSSNIIEYLKPKILRPLEKLQTLNLENNQIKAIHKNLLNLPNLKKVILNSNQITYLPTHALHGDECQVEELHLSGNRLIYIDNEFFENTHLKMINFGRNPWICKCLDDMVNTLRRNNIEFKMSEYLLGERPSCVVGPNNTCVHDLSLTDELFKQYNTYLQLYPVKCKIPIFCEDN